MRKCTIALAIALCGASYVVAAEPGDTQRQVQQPPQLPQGVQMKELNQIDNVRKELATVVEDAMTRGDFGKVVDNLAVENRDKMKDYKNQDFKTLDGLVEQLNKDWNQKYGHDFNIKRADNVFTNADPIVQGVVTDANAAAMNFPVHQEGAQTASQRQNPAGANDQSEQVEAKDLKDSKGVAVARLAAEGTGPAVDVSLIEEGSLLGSWHVAVPREMTSQQLHTQLQNHLSYIGKNAASWPADETQAYRLVARHVMMALYDQNVPQASK